MIKLFLGSEKNIDKSGSKDEQCNAITVDPVVEMIVSFLPLHIFLSKFIYFFLYLRIS